jgi:integrase
MSATTRPKKHRINKRFLSSLKVPPKGEKVYWDEELRGFGVRVLSSGIKSFIIYRRLSPTEQYKETLGRIGELKIGEARRIAEARIGEIANGKDPVADRRKAKANTFAALAEVYITRHCSTKKSGAEDERMIRKDLLPAWGTLPSKDITRLMVIELTDGIKDRGAPIQANRTLSCIKRIFNFGRARDLVEHNPAFFVEKPGKEKKRQRVLTDEEIRAFWEKLPDMDRAGRQVEDGLKLILVTAQRPGEVVAMEWSEIEGDLWTIPAEKSKNKLAHRVPLSPLALSILQGIPHVGKYAFPRRVGSGYTKDQHMARRSLSHAVSTNRALFDIPHWTPHDLRRTAASRFASMGASWTTIEKILNHIFPGIMAVYNRYGYDSEKRLALDAWADKLQQILEGKGADVIPIPLVK